GVGPGDGRGRLDAGGRAGGAHRDRQASKARARVARGQSASRGVAGVGGAGPRGRVTERFSMQTLILVLDLVGTFVFAVSGAAKGVTSRLDLFGILVLSFAAASAGSIARDVVIGAVPPAAIGDWRYLAVSVLAGVMTF